MVGVETREENLGQKLRNEAVSRGGSLIRFKAEGLQISREVREETKDAGSWRIALQSISDANESALGKGFSPIVDQTHQLELATRYTWLRCPQAP